MYRVKKPSKSTVQPIKRIGIFSWSLIGLIIIVIGILYVLSLIRIAIIPAVIGIFIAYMLLPLVKLLRYKLRKIWAVTIAYVIFLIIIFVLFFFIIPKVTEEFRTFITKLPSIIDVVSNFIQNFLKNSILLRNIENIADLSFIPQSSSEVAKFLADTLNLENFNIFSGAASVTVTLFNVILNFIIGPILGFYILKDSDKFIVNFVKIIPNKLRLQSITLIRRISNVFENYLRGQFFDAAIVAIIITVSMIVLRVDFASLIGVATFVFSLIPIIGLIIPIIPAAILALLSSPLKALIVTIIFIGVYIINYFLIVPRVMKDRTMVHPGIVLLSIIAGWALFGWLGVFLAIPFVAVIQEIIKYYLVKGKV